jgi:hypothetical protein
MYSAYDLECNEYFETGKNSFSYYQCMIDIWQYMTEDWQDEEIRTIPIQDVLDYSNVELRYHEEKIA